MQAFCLHSCRSVVHITHGTSSKLLFRAFSEVSKPETVSSSGAGTSTYSKEVDLDRLRNNLLKVNNFSKKKPGESSLLFYEITDKGVQTNKHLNLRELLLYVNTEARGIDDMGSSPGNKIKHVMKSTFSSWFIDDSGVRHAGHLTEEESESRMRKHYNHHNHHNSAKNDTFDHTNDNSVYNQGSEMSLRDLYRLDYLFNLNEEKSILIRRHAVLFAMDPIRAIVMADRLILLAPTTCDPIIEIIDQFMKEWVIHQQQRRLKNISDEAVGPMGEEELVPPEHYTPSNSVATMFPQKDPLNVGFEQHAFEGLWAVIKSLEFQEYDKVKLEVKRIQEHFESGALLPIDVQEKMRELKNTLSRMKSRVASSQRLLQQIIDDDDDLALMNLSLLKRKPDLYHYPLSHEIMGRKDTTQELLEAYLVDFNSLHSKLEYLKSQVHSGEELVSLRLDTSRNELLVTNTILVIVSCSIAFSSYVSSLFGMSLDNAITVPYTEEIFLSVTGVTMVIIPILSVVTLAYLKKHRILPTRAAAKTIKTVNAVISK